MLSEIGQSFCGKDRLTLKRSTNKIQMKIKCNIHLNDNLKRNGMLNI